MSSRFSWIRDLFGSWNNRSMKKRPYRRPVARPRLEELEVRELLSGSLSLAGGILTLADTGSPTITVAFNSTTNNYTVTDSTGFGSSSITNWTISGTTATETDGQAAQITQLAFNTTTGTFGAITSGAASIVITDAATATISGAITTTNQNFSIAAAGAIADNGNITTGSGTITINANTAGTGTNGFTQGNAVLLTTTNATTSALTINVGGAGNAVVNGAIVGTTAGGTYNCITNGGNIVGSNSVPADEHTTGDAPSFSLTAFTFNLNTNGGSANAGGSGSIGSGYGTATGTTGVPLILNDTTSASAGKATFISGSGGIYVIAFGNGLSVGTSTGDTFYVNTALASGAGNIFIQTADESGHDLHIQGNVNTGTGNIELDADDSVYLDSGVIGGTVNSQAFAGNVLIDVNMDLANSQQLIMSAGTIVTTSTAANAVVVNDYDTANGGIVAGNITVGNGGGITLNAAANASLATLLTTDGASNPTRTGSITQLSGATLNAGATGTITLTAAALSATAGGNITQNGSTSPIQTIAGTINATTSVDAGTSGGNIYINNQGPATFTATSVGVGGAISGVISLTTASGILTVGGATSTAGGTLTLTSIGTGGGINVNAALGNSTTGAITLNAGSNNVVINSSQTFFSSDPVTATTAAPLEITTPSVVTLTGSTITSSTGVQVDNGATLTGAGTAATGTSALNVNGALIPTVSATGLNSTDLTLQNNATMTVTLNGTGAGQFSQVNVNGPIVLNSPTLVINVGGSIQIGSQYAIINETGTSTPTGSFSNTSFTASNLPGYTFSVSYAGGSNNEDVVLTVTAVPTSDIFDVATSGTSATGTLSSVPFVNSNLTVALSSGVYTVTDSAEAISLTANATAAGWTSTNSNTITGPASFTSGSNTVNITNLAFNLVFGNETFNGAAAGAANLTVTGSGNLTIDGPVTTTGNVAVTGFTALDFEGNVTASGATSNVTVSGATNITDGAATPSTPGTLTANTLSLTASGGVGSSSLPILTAATTITAAAGTGGDYLTQAAGSPSIAATATGAGNIVLLDNDPNGTLTIGGVTSTPTGNITITAAGGVAVNANLGTSSSGAATNTGTITINANTANTTGGSAPGYTQNASAVLYTLNNSASAVSITVGGAGNALLAGAQVGDASNGGTYSVVTNGGNIIYNTTVSEAAHVHTASGGQAFVITAFSFNFNTNDGSANAGGTGSIGSGYGTTAGGTNIPLVINNSLSAEGTSTFIAGSGGIYVVDNTAGSGGGAFEVTEALATGAGNIFIQTSNEGGHDLHVEGPVNTGTGNIELDADDSVYLDAGTIGGTVNSQTFGGNVRIDVNMDLGNSQQLIMASGAAIATTSTSTSTTTPAVLLDATPTANGGFNPLSNITTGAGGAIDVNAAVSNGSGSNLLYADSTSSNATRDGSVAQLSGTTLNTGATGQINLTTAALASSGAATAGGNIGSASTPLSTVAGTITASTSINAGTTGGNIFISNQGGATFTATTSAATSGSQSGAIGLSTTNGALTIGGATSTVAGTLTLTSTGTGAGVVLNANIGSTTGGAITITGPLSGTGNIQMGTAGLSLSQSGNSSYGGVIKGSVTGNNVTYAGPGALTLTGTSIYTGSTTVSAGSLFVNGALSATSGLTVGATGLLGGSGSIAGPTVVNGTLAPGGGTGGAAQLTLAGLSFGNSSNEVADLNSTTAGTGYDQIVSTGTVTLNGSLQINLGSGFTPTLGTQFTIISDPTGSITGSYTSGSTVVAFNNPSYVFSVTVSAHSVILTVQDIITTPTIDVQGTTVYYETPSGINSVVTVSYNNTGGTYTVQDTAVSTITLTAAASAAGWTVTGNTASGPGVAVTNLLLDLNDGSDTIASLSANSANVAVAGTGTLTISGPMTTTAGIALSQFGTITDNGSVSSATGITVSDTGPLTLNGTGSFASSTGSISFGSDTISTGGMTVGSGLGFSTVAAGAVSFNANGSTITLGSITASGGVLAIQSASTLTLNGTLTDSSSITISNTGSVVAGTNENIVTPTLNITASSSIGTSGANLASAATNVTVSTGAGGVYISQTGSANFTATATGAGAIDILDTHAADSVTIAGATQAVGGNILISAAGSVFDNANITTGGTLTIDANTAGTGSAGFTQAVSAVITATSTSASALTINVGGSGNAVIAGATVGTSTGGTYTIITNGGNIVDSPSALYSANPEHILGSPPSFAITSYDFNLNTNGGSANAGGAGSIGSSDTTPLVINSASTAAGATSTFISGSGGIYVVAFGGGSGGAYHVAQALAAGAGNIFIQTSNESGHDLHIGGNVNTGSGSIELDADDSVYIDAGTVGGTVNSQTFSGTVLIDVNMDLGNSQQLIMAAGTAITTTNNTSTAVTVDAYPTNNGGENPMSNVTVGAGGTITLNGAANAANAVNGTLTTDSTTNATRDGSVSQLAGTVLNSGTSGTIDLTAAALSATAGGNIGSSGSGTIQTIASTINASTVLDDATAGGNIYINNQGPATFAATATVTPVTGSAGGTISLSTSNGLLTVGGATTDAGGSPIFLTSTGTNGGVTVAAPLGAASAGPIAINAGSNNVSFTTVAQNFYSADAVTITAGAPATIASTASVTLNNGSWTAANGTQVASGAYFAGTGTLASNLTVQGGGTLSPGLGALNGTSVTLNSTSDFDVTLDGTGAGNFSQFVYTGTATLGNASLLVSVGGNLAVGNTFTIVSTTGGTLAGIFGNAATTVAAVNNPYFVFGVSYAGNQVTLTVNQVPNTDVVDVVGSTVDFYSLFGVNNNLTVGYSGGNYSINDSAQSISLTQNAINAGWTGGGTNTVTGPGIYNSGSTTITTLNFDTEDGTDILSSVVAGAANINVIGATTGSLQIEGNITTTGNVSMTGYTGITDTTGIVTANNLIMNAPGGVGAGGTILTAANSDVATATGSGASIAITQTGPGSVTTNAYGTINIADTAGALAVAATSTTGDITLTSADSLTLIGNVNAGTGHIIISADTDGLAAAGTNSYNQAGFSLITTNTDDQKYNPNGTDAAIITVNTASAGLGNAVIGMGSIGTNAGGEILVNSNGGSILWSNDPVYAAFTGSQTGLANGGGNTQTLQAEDYDFIATGAGSIGTNARPVQTDANASVKGLNDADMLLAAGSGGIYVTEWGNATNDAVTLDGATATGAGNIRVVAANAGAHNMYVDGNVITGSGSIALYADDDLILTSSLLPMSDPFYSGGSAQIGGTGFSGTVDLQANRDNGNEQILDMMAGTSIVTSNTSSTAVNILCNSSVGSSDTPGDALIPNGGVVLTSITTGAGGGITVAANNAGGANGSSAPAGSIVQRTGGLLNVGTTGTITLIADANGTTNNDGNIGTSSAPIQVTGGTVTATTLGITAGTVANPTGNIYISSTGNTNFAGATTGSSTATVNITESTGNLVISGPTYSAGGAINITDSDTSPTGGINLNAPLGNATSGATVITGVVNMVLTTPAATYGSIASNGAAINLSTASLNPTEGTGFNPAPAPTAIYDILVNSTGVPIAAPFSNYTQGQIFTIGSDSYEITYLGGASGNDVELLYLAPVITQQPTNQTAQYNTTVTFTAAAVGVTVTPTVQWYVNSGSGFTAISGATSPTLTLNNVALAMSGNQYEAKFTNPYGTVTTSAATLSVIKANTATTLTDNGPNPSTSGQSVQFTVTVSPQVPNGESVQLYDGSLSNPVGSPGTLTSGTVNINVSTLSVGTHSIFAVYGGDANYNGSQSSNVTQVVNPSQTSTTTTLTDNGPNPSVVGIGVNFSGTVTPAVPSGETVTLEDASNGNAVVATTTTTASSTFTFSNITSLSIGTHNLFAVYAGDSNFTSSQSSNVSQVVNPIQVSSVTTNGDYIPAVSATESGNTVTLTTDGNSGFGVGNSIVVAGFTTTGYNGTWTITAVSGNTVQYSDSNSGLAATGNSQTTSYAISANTSSDLGPGFGSSNQRSMVDSIVYTFNTPVNLAANAFNMGTVAPTTVGPATPATGDPNYVLTTPDGGTTWVVTWTSGTNNSVVGHSIADGVYTITLNSSAVTAVSGGSTMTTSRPTDTFYRLYGDFNGSKKVNGTSANHFNTTLNVNTGGAGYLAYFDYNSDGKVNGTDANQFNGRLNSTWSNFTPTI